MSSSVYFFSVSRHSPRRQYTFLSDTLLSVLLCRAHDNRFVSLISFYRSLSEYKTLDFCPLVLCLSILLDLFITFNNWGWVSSRFLIYLITQKQWHFQFFSFHVGILSCLSLVLLLCTKLSVLAWSALMKSPILVLSLETDLSALKHQVWWRCDLYCAALTH